MTQRAAGAVPGPTTPDTGMFRSLRLRNFRLFFLGQSVSQAGTWVQMIAQTLLVLELTNSVATA